MKQFTKQETKGLVIILGVLLLISIPNFIASLRRARDAQRKADIGSIHDSLLRYAEDFGSFPLSVDGKISACGPVTIEKNTPTDTIIFSPCDWGKDALKDLSDENYPAYINTIPNDPWNKKGWSYLYFSNGRRFQILGSLEGKSEDEYDEKIIDRNLKCGEKICNFGKSFSRTPLDRSIEEYENQINAKQ